MSRNAIIAVVVWIIGAIVLNTCGSKRETQHMEEGTSKSETVSQPVESVNALQNQGEEAQALQAKLDEFRMMLKEKSTALEEVKLAQSKVLNAQKKEKDSLEEKIKQLSISNSALVARSQELADINKVLLAEQEGKNQTLSDALSKLSVAQESYKKLQQEQKSMLAWKEESTSKLQTLEQEKLQMAGLLATLKDEKLKLEKNLADKQIQDEQSLISVVQEKGTLEGELNASKQEIHAKSEELARLGVLIEKQMKDKAELEQIYQSEKKVRIMAEEEAVKAYDEMERLKALLGKQDSLVQKVEELNISNSRLQTQLDELAELKSKTEELEKEKEMHEKILQAEQEVRVKAEAELEKVVQENKRLQALLAQKSAVPEQNITAIMQEKDALAQKVRALSSINSNLQVQIDALTEAKAKLVELEKEKEALNKNLQIAKSSLAKLKEESGQAAAKNKKLQTLLKEKDAASEQKIAASMQKNRALEQKIKELNAANVSLKASYTKEESSAKGALAKLAALMVAQKKLSAEKSQIVSLMQQGDAKLSQEAKEKQQALEHANKLDIENKRLQALLQATKASADKSVSAMQEEKGKLALKVQGLAAENEKLQAQIKDFLDQSERNVAELKENEELWMHKLDAAQKADKGKEEKIKILMREKEGLELRAREALASKARLEAETKAKEELLGAFALTHVEFRTNSPELLEKSKQLLDSAAEVIKKYPDFRYEIQGHTDNTGNEDKNLELSQKRAQSVKNYLVEKGVDASILEAKGFGSLQPIASNETKAGKLQNRRVVFKVIRP